MGWVEMSRDGMGRDEQKWDEMGRDEYAVLKGCVAICMMRQVRWAEITHLAQDRSNRIIQNHTEPYRVIECHTELNKVKQNKT